MAMRNPRRRQHQSRQLWRQRLLLAKNIRQPEALCAILGSRKLRISVQT
jgi:hypothetical protein